MMRMIKDRGLHILNGNKRGDEEGELTYVDKKGLSVIDYVLTNSKGWNRTEKLQIGDRMDSDHLPLTVGVMAEGAVDSEEGQLKKEVIN
ncbi:hypothetical protein WH47_03088 [Habropoda laboriosa]|uniref:Endonuclease/exonuclease/phosphatase domain-containing protein n=1 Tax=Habropoda laboriosa TaxID=597456 RepID=A0A0L7QYG1_9HYME|nr:hypothetical protein WH47_03088 [Habropoda laboriosa]